MGCDLFYPSESSEKEKAAGLAPDDLEGSSVETHTHDRGGFQASCASDLSDLLSDGPDNLTVALDLARRGFAVFPQRDWGDGDGWKPIKDFPAKASTDAAQIAMWWAEWPDARVGLLTGERNGITVLDVDVKNDRDGQASLALLGFPDLTAMTPVRSRTPSGGWHLFFAFDPAVKGTVGKIGPGLDVRNRNQFVVAPGSLKDGRRYYVEEQPLGSVTLPPFPAKLVLPPAPEREPATVLATASDDQRQWAAGVLAKKTAELAATAEGARNGTLNGAAMWAGGAAAHGMLTEEQAKAALVPAAVRAGVSEKEARRAFRHAWKDGLAKPIGDYPQGWEDAFEDLPPRSATDLSDLLGDGKSSPALPARGSTWHVPSFAADELPDLSHDQLATELGRVGWDKDARYVAQLGGWHLWKGHRWEPSPGMEPMSIVRSYVKAKASALIRWAEGQAAALKADGKAADADKLIASARGQAKALRQEPSIAAVERLARSNRRSLASADQWDCDDLLLGTPDCTVDLRTGELRPSNRNDYITKATSVSPAPQGAMPSAWLKFLAEIFPDDPAMPGFIQRLAGYALTGSTREHRLFLFHGTGRNGKGTLLGTLQDIMGDYAKGIPTNALLETRNPQHSSPLARLRGARLVRGAELPVGQVWNESLVKQMTGGDMITANMMRQDSFEFTPKFTLIVDANTKPRIRTTDPAMRARMTLVPFTASFMGREDRGLPDRLKAEAGAILRWMIDGSVAWQRHGLGIPASVEQASRDYLDSEDTLADFIEEETQSELMGTCTVAALYARYVRWAEEQGGRPITRRSFSDALVERGFERRRGAKGAKTFYGIRLRDDFEDAPQSISASTAVDGGGGIPCHG